MACRGEAEVVGSWEWEEKSKKIEEFEYSELEAATNGFSERKLVGKGSHGYVYKAVVGGRRVAVKRPCGGEVDNEIDILSKIQSPRLVNLVGFSSCRERRLLVVEFMSNGTLYDVLHSTDNPPNWGRRIRLALQTAKAIMTIHSCSPAVIHRDIKSANVLLDRRYNARLADFGLALREGSHLPPPPPAGTIGYLDPSYVSPHHLSTKTDVFSFGILLLEIISGRKAIDMSFSPPSILDWAIPLIKTSNFLSLYDPRIPPPNHPILRNHLPVIASKCVRSSSLRRPSINHVVSWLSSLSKFLPPHSFPFPNPCILSPPLSSHPFPLSTNLMHLLATTDQPSTSSSSKNRIRIYRPCGTHKDAIAFTQPHIHHSTSKHHPSD